jgi:hypothetical protein
LFNLVLFTELPGQSGKLIIEKIFKPIQNFDGFFVKGNVGPFTKVFYGDEIFREITESGKDSDLKTKNMADLSAGSAFKR